ncbi:MAG: aminopeptidase P family protein [Chloroflexia bacterium]|nr:aminopeptidase P family protein [Chloroflexia bacterium]
MSNEALERTFDALVASRCDAAVLSSIANVTYATDWEVPVPFGAGAELAWGSPTLLCHVRERRTWLIVPDGMAAGAQETAKVDTVVSFATFDSFVPVDSRTSFVKAIRDSLGDAGFAGGSGTVAIEERSLPQVVANVLTSHLDGWELVDADPAMQQARAIKTPREIELLRRAAAVSDVSHETLSDLCREAGATEFSMWAEIGMQINATAGFDVPLSGELITGPRAAYVAYPNGPGERTTEPADIVLMDLSGRVDGYWFDCTNTHVVGAKPTREQRRYLDASRAACEAAMAALKPGARACDAASAAEAAFSQYSLPMAHYAGHQIGVTVNELPRLVPYDTTVIEPGMVFSVEPGAYEGKGGSIGARSEKMVLVTDAGPEILSQFEWGN